MTLAGTALLVGDPADAAAYQAVLKPYQGLRILTATDLASGLAAARIHRPDLVVTDRALPDGSGLALGRAIKEDDTLEGTLVVVLEPSADAPVEIAAEAEVDDFLIKPVGPADLVARVRSMLRLKRLHDQLRADKLELERLNRAVAERLDNLLALLVQLVDLRVPGAAARGADSARLAAQLADRFEIPPVLRRDLTIAAQLHEIGKVVLATEQAEGDEVEDVLEGDAWRYVVAARDLLRQTDGLEPAADLIGASFENWDGTGHPDRLRQGQVPLRSRILRCLIDYHALLESGQAATPPTALDRLAAHSGTRYDPLVVAYLDAIVRAGADAPATASRARVPITKLEEGMVLADDLCTSSGVKLLAAGAQLTQATLETIRRRHRSDPIVHGVWVRRGTPAA